MTEPAKNNPLVVHLTADELREIVREEIERAFKNGKPAVVKDWLRADELAEQYGLPKTWFEERGRTGDIARTKPGRYTLFHRKDVEVYLERNKGTDWPKRKRKKKQIDLTSSNTDTT
jgi:hypothetical protein